MRKFLILPVFLAACTGGYVPPEGKIAANFAPAFPAPEDDTCGGGDYAALIGQSATELETVLIMKMVRIIRPGDFVTMDFRLDRLNFELDESDIIVRIFCG